jgi:hypothetical protein
MKLRMTVRDCLYLNWALPAETMPELPAPLRYQLHSWQGRDWVFASALLFHQDAVRLAAFPLIRVGYPQFNLRLYVLDGEGMPSVFFCKMLMPGWVAPGVRLMSHQPAAAARLDFPRPTLSGGDGPWHWRVACGGPGLPRLEVRAWRDGSALPSAFEGPRIGSWEETVRYFQERLRGYAEGNGALRRIDVRRSQVGVWPLRVQIAGQEEVLPRLIHQPPLVALAEGWPPLHSAWLAPEVPFVFELAKVPRVVSPAAPGMPQPAAGRVAGAWRANAALRKREPEDRSGDPQVGPREGPHEGRRASC